MRYSVLQEIDRLWKRGVENKNRKKVRYVATIDKVFPSNI